MRQVEEELIWAEWKRVTRFFYSASVAFEREALLWSSLQVEKDGLRLVVARGPNEYSVTIGDHLAALSEGEVLNAVVLTATYGLAESFGRIRLGLAEDELLRSGIEVWGSQMLESAGKDWSDVPAGRVGLIEVAVVRNALAHGIRKVNQRMIRRFEGLNLVAPWVEGVEIRLTRELTETYRSRLKSLVRIATPRTH